MEPILGCRCSLAPATTTGSGNVYLNVISTGGVTVQNTSDTALTAGASFNLTSAASISVATNNATAIASPAIALTAGSTTVDGSIGPLQVSSGKVGTALSLSASAQEIS